jgi:hypothetical protein
MELVFKSPFARDETSTERYDTSLLSSCLVRLIFPVDTDLLEEVVRLCRSVGLIHELPRIRWIVADRTSRNKRMD